MATDNQIQELREKMQAERGKLLDVLEALDEEEANAPPAAKANGAPNSKWPTCARWSRPIAPGSRRH